MSHPSATTLQTEARCLGLPINLHVYRSNPAIRLYRRHGFQITEETTDMFTMTWGQNAKGLPLAMKLRHYDRSDAEALAAVYRDAAATIGRQAYAADQVRVWALYPDDIEEFRVRLARGLTLVAEADNAAVAFGQLDPCDHVAFIYCASAYARRGIASAIYDRLEAHATAQGASNLTTDASCISRPFFEKKGFKVTAIEHSLRLGVSFERFRMSKPLTVV